MNPHPFVPVTPVYQYETQFVIFDLFTMRGEVRAILLLFNVSRRDRSSFSSHPFYPHLEPQNARFYLAVWHSTLLYSKLTKTFL
jgi:hypothetical protein